MRNLANSAARDIASPAVKMGNKGLFPGVAVPLAFFCTLFFRHRKKSVSAPWGCKPFSRAGVGASSPTGAGICACGRTGGFPLAPSPLRIATRSNRAPHGTASPNPRRSRRVIPRHGELLTATLLPMMQAGGFPLAPCTPSDRSRRENSQELSSGQTIGAARTRRKNHGVNIPTESAGAFLKANHQRGPPSHSQFPFSEIKKGSIHAASSEKKIP